MRPALTYIITGGNTGLGYQCARFLGANPKNLVVIACRDKAKAADAAGQLRQAGSAVKFLQLDLASLESVRSFVKEYDQMNLPPLAGIVCNAGIQNVSTPTKTIDQYEATFGINHLAHYLLVRLLLPAVQPHGHIVFVSSDTHDPKEKTGLPEPRYTTASDIANDFELGQVAGRRRYTTSKLCNIYCTYELARRLAKTSDERLKSIKVSAFDPGMMPGTGLARTYPAPLQFVWKYILPAATMFQGNVHRPAESGERLAKLVSNGDALTSGQYYSDGQAKPSSPLSYSKENAIDLWNTSAEMVGLSPPLPPICRQPETPMVTCGSPLIPVMVGFGALLAGPMRDKFKARQDQCHELGAMTLLRLRLEAQVSYCVIALRSGQQSACGAISMPTVTSTWQLQNHRR